MVEGLLAAGAAAIELNERELAMLAKLGLTELRLVLQAAADELVAEAERHPDAPDALKHLRVASKIKEIDRQIGWLDKELSRGHSRRRFG